MQSEGKMRRTICKLFAAAILAGLLVACATPCGC